MGITSWQKALQMFHLHTGTGAMHCLIRIELSYGGMCYETGLSMRSGQYSRAELAAVSHNTGCITQHRSVPVQTLTVVLSPGKCAPNTRVCLVVVG